MKMNIAGTRTVEAVREFVGAGIAGIAFVASATLPRLAAINRVREIGRIDLINESELNQVADARTKCRPRSWQSNRSFRVRPVGRRRHRRLCAELSKHSHMLRRALRSAAIAGRRWWYAEGHPLLFVAQQDRSLQFAARRSDHRNRNKILTGHQSGRTRVNRRSTGCRSGRWTLCPSRARGQYDQNEDRKSTRLNSSHANISYAVFCLKKKKKKTSSVCIVE